MANNNAFKVEVEAFKNYLTKYQLSLMQNDPNEYQIQKAVSMASGKKVKGKEFPYESIKSTFLRSIKGLGPRTKDKYSLVIPKLKMCRDAQLINGDLLLLNDYDKKGLITNQFIDMTNRSTRENDFVGFCHEMGHIKKGLPNVPHEYYEFTEAFSIFLEYLAFKEIRPTEAYDLFKQYRSEISKEMAQYYLRCNREYRNNGSVQDMFLTKEKIEVVKYITSLELALALIDRYENDRQRTDNELDTFATGEKSMRDVAKSLDIDTTGCPRLMKMVSKR